MSKPIKLKKGDRVVCTHYKDRPVCIVTDVDVLTKWVDNTISDEIWINCKYPRWWMGAEQWWSPRNWLRKLPKKK